VGPIINSSKYLADPVDLFASNIYSITSQTSLFSYTHKPSSLLAIIWITLPDKSERLRSLTEPDTSRHITYSLYHGPDLGSATFPPLINLNYYLGGLIYHLAGCLKRPGCRDDPSKLTVSFPSFNIRDTLVVTCLIQPKDSVLNSLSCPLWISIYLEFTCLI
jgi:hypothetical protein